MTARYGACVPAMAPRISAILRARQNVRYWQHLADIPIPRANSDIGCVLRQWI